MKPHEWTDGGDKVLMLRRCNADLSSSRGFVWPALGPVEFADFLPLPTCGGGGHGWPWGMGLGEGADYDIIGDKWLVVAASADHVVGELDGGLKCKISRGEVVFCGAFAAAWAMINSGRHRLIEEMSKDDSGDSSKAASSGDYSKAASSGNYSTAASSGNYSTAASSGSSSTAASSGDSSTAEAIGENTAAAVVGSGGRVKVGRKGAFAIAYWSEVDGYRFLAGKVGENGIKADTWYEVKNGELCEVTNG